MGTVDLSRDVTDFRKRYDGVRMQQGRVLSEDDFNEAERIDEEDMRRTRVDVIGPVGSPDAGFLPAVPGALAPPLVPGGKIHFDISAGTLYLGGRRLEQPAAEPFELQKDWLNFDAAVDWPNLPAAGSRIDLVYVEALQVPVVAEEDSEKFEVALGSADTSANVRTLRRVAVRPGMASDDCVAAWAEATAAWAPSLGVMAPDMEIATAARLRVTFTDPPDPGDLCSPPVAGGYMGAENQAIRVQMVDATHYTWGFDNVSPMYRVQVSQIIRNGLPVTLVKLLSAPKDAVHWPLKDQVVEILAWSAALPNGETLAEVDGQLARVTASYNPDDQTLEIDTPLLPGFGVQWKTRSDKADFFDGTPEDDYFFLRVWNRGDDLVSAPAISILSGDLGNTGLHVSFLGGPLRKADHWIIAARPSTQDKVVPWLLETLAGAPPNGLKRYRAPLGLIRWTVAGGAVLGEVIDDCRRPFLPLTKLRGCCTLTVGDGTTSFGMYSSIQAAIQALPAAGGTVCVLPGTYNESVTIQNKANVLVHGCDARARVRAVATALGPEPAFLVIDSHDVAIERLGLEAGPRSAVEIARSQRVAVRRCVIQMRDLPTIFQAIWARGLDLVIEGNLVDILSREAGVPGGLGTILNHATDGVSPPPPVVIGHATRGGIQLGGGCERVRVLGNVIRGGIWNGITLGSLILVGNNDDDVPDKPNSLDPCDPCHPLDSGGDDDDPNVHIRSGGDLYEIEIRDNVIEDMGANGIGVIRFFTPSKTPLLIIVHGLHIQANLIRRCLRREIAPAPQAMLGLIGYGGISLAAVTDLRICDNEIVANGASHLEPVCGIFALVVENAHIDGNRIRDNGPRRSEEPAASAKPGTRGGIWIWLTLAHGGPREGRQELKRWDGVPAAVIRDNLVVAPVGRAITLFALGPLVVARNRLVSQGSRGRDLDILSTTVLLANLGLATEWTLGLLLGFLALQTGKVKGVDPCVFMKVVGLLNPADGSLWPPLTTLVPSGKSLVTENQISCDSVDQPLGFAFSAVMALSLDDLGFTDNQCEIDSTRLFYVADAFLAGGSVRVADNRFAETWLHAFFSAWSIAFMNTTTDNQATHCIRADAALPAMRVMRDNLSFISAFCPRECARFDG
jgi:hypothetical protein